MQNNVQLNQTNHLSLILPADAFGNVTVEIKKDNGEYEILQKIEVIDKSAITFKLPTHHIGNYYVKAYFEGNYKIEGYSKYIVNPPYSIIVPYDYYLFGDKIEIKIYLPQDSVGTLTLELKRNETDNFTLYKSVEMTNGSASIEFPTNVGAFYYNALYSGNYEILNETNKKVIVRPLLNYQNNIFTVTCDNETEGTFIIEKTHDAWRYTIKETPITNGKAEIDITEYLENIDNSETVVCSFNNVYGETLYINSYTLEPINYKITAKDTAMYYNDGNSFKAKIYVNDQPLKAFQKVTLKIGSKTYTVKTNEKGEISKKFTLTPGKYTVKIIYKKDSQSKKLTVKQVLTLKSVKVKKSAKKLVLQATLKNKNPIKNKQVTFKFNGKTYKAKTNSKGIAKVTVKANILKKLKVGKKITYQATYRKDTVKKTIKVQK